MSKVLSVRIDEKLYTKVSTNKKPRGEIVTQALEHYFNTRQKKKPGADLNDHIIQDLRQKISQLKRHQDHCNDEIRFLRDLHQQTMD